MTCSNNLRALFIFAKEVVAAVFKNMMISLSLKQHKHWDKIIIFNMLYLSIVENRSDRALSLKAILRGGSESAFFPATSKAPRNSLLNLLCLR